MLDEYLQPVITNTNEIESTICLHGLYTLGWCNAPSQSKYVRKKQTKFQRETAGIRLCRTGGCDCINHSVGPPPGLVPGSSNLSVLTRHRLSLLCPVPVHNISVWSVGLHLPRQLGFAVCRFCSFLISFLRIVCKDFQFLIMSLAGRSVFVLHKDNS